MLRWDDGRYGSYRLVLIEVERVLAVDVSNRFSVECSACQAQR